MHSNLNALIGVTSPTNTQRLQQQQQQQHFLNAPNTINSDSNWHFNHYHKPYHFGSKPPKFFDYETTTTITNANDLDFFDPALDGPVELHYRRLLLHALENNNNNGLKYFDHLAQLSCDSGEMILRLNFSEPFKGIVYPNHNRLSPCRFFGDGHHNYELRLPLRGCGTRQVSVYLCVTVSVSMMLKWKWSAALIF